MKRALDRSARPRAEARPAQATDEPARHSRIPVELRHQRMMRAFLENGFISVIDMAAEIGVSTMTIRRDLDLLEHAGKIARIHGGAVAVRDGEPIRTDDEESIFDRRLLLHADAKAAIARAAADLVQPAQAVGLDTGTTVLTAARYLTGRKGMRFVTNNLRAAMLLSNTENRVYMLGGEVRVPELSVVGSGAIRTLQNQFLDLALIGVSALDENGIYDFSPEDTEVKAALMQSASMVVVLCDSSKFSRRALARVGTLDAIDVIVTDQAPPAGVQAALTASNVRIIIAPPAEPAPAHG